jgi:hypothetical protein
MGVIKDLKKKYPEIEELINKFLESNCCEEDEEQSKG